MSLPVHASRHQAPSAPGARHRPARHQLRPHSTAWAHLAAPAASRAVQGRRQRPGAPVCAAVREQATGVEFPEVASFWVGEPSRCVGAGVRAKKIAFLGVKVYAVGLYVEAEKAARELGVRARGGFFQADDDYAQALTDGAFAKVLVIELVRRVDGKTFYEAFDEALKSRMSLTGEGAVLGELGAFFQGRDLEKGTAIALLWRPDGGLEVALGARDTNWGQAQPGLKLSSASLGRALFEVYLGSSSVVPEAKAAWVQGARKLLESETVRRQSR